VRSVRVLVLFSGLMLAGCGGDSGDSGSVSAIDGGAVEEAYGEAYRASWIRSCRAAVAEIRTDGPRGAADVSCSRPVEQMEGNTSFDPEQARVEGRRQGMFDGCAYAWDEAYAASGEVEPRC
jgi:hypothetical protein